MALARHQDAGHNGEEKLTLKARAFLGQCPLILLVALLVVWRLPTPASPAAPAAPARQVADCKHSRFSRIDVLGSITLLCTISLTLLILDMGGKQMSFTSPAMVGLICTTTGTAAAFVLIEAYWANEPVFPLRLAANRGVASAYTMAALQLAAEYGVCLQLAIQGPDRSANATSTRSFSRCPSTSKSRRLQRHLLQVLASSPVWLLTQPAVFWLVQ